MNLCFLAHNNDPKSTIDTIELMALTENKFIKCRETYSLYKSHHNRLAAIAALSTSNYVIYRTHIFMQPMLPTVDSGAGVIKILV